MGTLGDRIGRRRLLMIGAGAFGLVSIMAAFSVSAEMLILSRALLGIAGATLMPSTLALIRNMFHDEAQRTTAIAAWMSSFMIGTGLKKCRPANRSGRRSRSGLHGAAGR